MAVQAAMQNVNLLSQVSQNAGNIDTVLLKWNKKRMNFLHV
jgi:hypothetical protein